MISLVILILFKILQVLLIIIINLTVLLFDTNDATDMNAANNMTHEIDGMNVSI